MCRASMAKLSHNFLQPQLQPDTGYRPAAAASPPPPPLLPLAGAAAGRDSGQFAAPSVGQATQLTAHMCRDGPYDAAPEGGRGSGSSSSSSTTAAAQQQQHPHNSSSTPQEGPTGTHSVASPGPHRLHQYSEASPADGLFPPEVSQYLPVGQSTA